MRRALEAAARARGRTAPNPAVGAVVVRDGELLAEGWTWPPPGAHAEPSALDRARRERGAGSTRGATMYVSLEPCCFHGRTPPCTEAILAAGIRRVVIGAVDPHPRVRGRGIQILRDAGLAVVGGVEEAACRELNAGFIKAEEQGLPRVWLKAAATLDGRIADAAGASQWITGPEARAEGRRYRDQVDAILVGSGTLLSDDPRLSTRLPGGHDPVPVVLDGRLRCPADARIFGGGRRPLIYTAPEAPERALPAEIVRVPRAPGGLLDVETVLRDLVARGVRELLVEGGGAVHRSFLEAGLADRLLLFLAPTILAGGPGFVAGPPLSLAAPFGGSLRSSRRVGEDLLLEIDLRPRRGD